MNDQHTKALPSLLGGHLQEIVAPFRALADMMDQCEGKDLFYSPHHVLSALAEWASWRLEVTAGAIVDDIGSIEIDSYSMVRENQEEGIAGLVCGARLKLKEGGRRHE